MCKPVVFLVFLSITVCRTWGEEVQLEFQGNTHRSPRSLASFIRHLLGRNARQHGDYVRTSDFVIGRYISPTIFSVKRSYEDSTSSGGDIFIPFVPKELEPSPIISPDFLSPEPSPSRSMSVSGTPSPMSSPLASQSRTPTATPTTVPVEVPVSPSPSQSVGANATTCTCPNVVIKMGGKERPNGLSLVHTEDGKKVFRVRIKITERNSRPGNAVLRVEVSAVGKSNFPKLIRAKIDSRQNKTPFRNKGGLLFKSKKNPDQGTFGLTFDFDESNYCLGNKAGYPRTVGAWGRAKYKDANGITQTTNRLFTRSFRLICKE